MFGLPVVCGIPVSVSLLYIMVYICAPHFKMASSNEVEEQDDCSVISLNLSIPRENLIEIVESSEDGRNFVKKVRESLQKQTEKEAKWRSDMTDLRRARINAGL